jgi:hypothetical protein
VHLVAPVGAQTSHRTTDRLPRQARDTHEKRIIIIEKTMAFRLLQVIYDWLAPGWGWGNPGTITAKGFPVVSTLGLYISSDQVGIATWSPHFSFIIP